MKRKSRRRAIIKRGKIRRNRKEFTHFTNRGCASLNFAMRMNAAFDTLSLQTPPLPYEIDTRSNDDGSVTFTFYRQCLPLIVDKDVPDAPVVSG